MQAEFPPEGEREFPSRCAWCGDSPARPYQVEKPRYGKAANGQRVLKRQAVTVPACTACSRRFDRYKDQDDA